jgi:polysaccharide biosynthesis/export protein
MAGVLGLILTAIGPERPVLGQSPSAAAVLDAVTYKEAEGGSVVQLQISGTLVAFSCTIPAPGERNLVIELTGAGTRLPDRIDLKNAVVPEAIIERPGEGRSGLRVRLAIEQGVLARVDQSEHGLLLRLARSSSTEAAEYRVGVGDKIEINVFGHDDLSKIVEVRADGSVNYPLIGDMQVAGKTVAEVDAEVTRTLGKDYLVDPQVSVDIREYQSRWVTIIGEVRTPGKYVLKRNMRLIDVLAEAGGATKEAGSRILITRQVENGSPRQVILDRDRLLSQNNQDSNVLLQHGDIVTIGEKEVFYIRGEVTKPGAYLLESGMTVLKAISLAGGFTQFANRKQVDILRAGSSGVQSKVTINVKAIEDGKKQDLPIQPNDTIIVPRRIF